MNPHEDPYRQTLSGLPDGPDAHIVRSRIHHESRPRDIAHHSNPVQPRTLIPRAKHGRVRRRVQSHAYCVPDRIDRLEEGGSVRQGRPGRRGGRVLPLRIPRGPVHGAVRRPQSRLAPRPGALRPDRHRHPGDGRVSADRGRSGHASRRRIRVLPDAPHKKGCGDRPHMLRYYHGDRRRDHRDRRHGDSGRSRHRLRDVLRADWIRIEEIHSMVPEADGGARSGDRSEQSRQNKGER